MPLLADTEWVFLKGQRRIKGACKGENWLRVHEPQCKKGGLQKGLEGLGHILYQQGGFFSPVPHSCGYGVTWPASPKAPLSLSLGSHWKSEAVGLHPPRLLGVRSPGQTADSSPGSGSSHCRPCSRETPPARRARPGTWWNSLGPRTCHPEAKGRTGMLSGMIIIIHPPRREQSGACVRGIPKWLLAKPVFFIRF